MRLIHICSKCKKEWEAEGVPTDKDLCSICSPEFKSFSKIARLNREIIITEKLDGSNGVIYIDESNNIYAGSRNRWLDEHNENMGFWHWVMENKQDLLNLGQGRHYGEWVGKGIQRNYGLDEKRFYLFNVGKWVKQGENKSLGENQQWCPDCCYVVPILWIGNFDTLTIQSMLDELKRNGSVAVPGFMKPEGIVIFHSASGQLYKVTLENDEKPKGAK